MLNSWYCEDIENLLRSRIELAGLPDTMETRIDFLETLVTVLRYRHAYVDRKVEFEHFLQCSVTADEWIACSASDKYEPLGAGRSSVLLQPDLLIFLMLHDRREYRVLDIIERFVKQLHAQELLSVLDFKTTETGVIRCFTNTRFAAKELREYGFLLFTKTEAYKTWRLTLAGFVTAAVLMDRRHSDSWKEPAKSDPFPLHLEIRDAWDRIKNFDSFVATLARVCKPNIELFKRGEPVLRQAHVLLSQYWTHLRNKDLKAQERQALCHEYMKRLEENKDIDAFKQEFSACVMVDALLTEV